MKREFSLSVDKVTSKALKSYIDLFNALILQITVIKN